MNERKKLEDNSWKIRDIAKKLQDPAEFISQAAKLEDISKGG